MLSGILTVIGFIPTAIGLIEKVYVALGRLKMSSSDKHSAVVALVRDAIITSEGFAGKDIADEELFSDGLDQTIDGIVKMLNASVWYKKK